MVPADRWNIFGQGDNMIPYTIILDDDDDDDNNNNNTSNVTISLLFKLPTLHLIQKISAISPPTFGPTRVYGIRVI